MVLLFKSLDVICNGLDDHKYLFLSLFDNEFSKHSVKELHKLT